MWSSRHHQSEPEPERSDVTVAPDAQPEPPAKGVRPICMFGTKAEKQARFGPPLPPPTQMRRLVSLGRQVHRDPGSSRQKGRILEYEAFVDMQHPREKWIRWPGEKEPHRADDVTYASDPKPEPIGTIPRRPGGPSAHFPAGRADEIVPPPEVSDEARAVARAMFARSEGGPGQTVTPAFDPLPW
jgi:hypothetical protein